MADLSPPERLSTTLGDGRHVDIWMVPSTGWETNFVVQEVLSSDEYFQHGISLAPGDTVVDIGANIGTFGIRALSKAQGVRYVAAEPAPPTFEVLKANLLGSDGQGAGSFFDLNRKDYGHALAPPYPGNVTLVNAAVTSAPGTLPFTWYPSAPGNSTLVPDEKVAMQGWFMSETLQGPRSFDVRALTLDGLLAEAGVEGPVALLKVDVEGAELDVLRGASPALLQRVQQVVLEVHDCLPGEFDQGASPFTDAAPGPLADALTEARAAMAAYKAAAAANPESPPPPPLEKMAKIVLPGPRGGGIDGDAVRFEETSAIGLPTQPPRDGGRTMAVVELLRAAGFRVVVACPLGLTLNYSVYARRSAPA